MTRLMILLSCCTLLWGCSRWTYELGAPLSEGDLPASNEQVALSSVLEQLGPPQRLAAIADGYVLAWEHWRIQENALGVSLGPLGVDLFSFDWGRARIAGEFIVLRFDQQHRLTDQSFARWDEVAGAGTALQPSIGVVDVISVGDLLLPMPQHRWGAQWLQPMPAPLNAQSSPDTGQGSLEQRGTPAGAGQRTMEWAD